MTGELCPSAAGATDGVDQVCPMLVGLAPLEGTQFVSLPRFGQPNFQSNPGVDTLVTSSPYSIRPPRRMVGYIHTAPGTPWALTALS